MILGSNKKKRRQKGKDKSSEHIGKKSALTVNLVVPFLKDI